MGLAPPARIPTATRDRDGSPGVSMRREPALALSRPGPSPVWRKGPGFARPRVSRERNLGDEARDGANHTPVFFVTHCSVRNTGIPVFATQHAIQV
jgi:hypothetical protein